MQLAAYKPHIPGVSLVWVGYHIQLCYDAPKLGDKIHDVKVDGKDHVIKILPILTLNLHALGPMIHTGYRT